eukprot:1160237-Pelagomonas_calceolata.AAC.4
MINFGLRLGGQVLDVFGGQKWGPCCSKLGICLKTGCFETLVATEAGLPEESKLRNSSLWGTYAGSMQKNACFQASGLPTTFSLACMLSFRAEGTLGGPGQPGELCQKPANLGAYAP